MDNIHCFTNIKLISMGFNFQVLGRFKKSIIMGFLKKDQNSICLLKSFLLDLLDQMYKRQSCAELYALSAGINFFRIWNKNIEKVEKTLFFDIFDLFRHFCSRFEKKFYTSR